MNPRFEIRTEGRMLTDKPGYDASAPTGDELHVVSGDPADCSPIPTRVAEGSGHIVTKLGVDLGEARQSAAEFDAFC